MRIYLTTLACALSTAFAPQPDVKTLLRHAAEYAVEYHDRFTALVAEEEYVQRTGPDPHRPYVGRSFVEKERTLRSEYVIVRDYAGAGSWVAVRDVFEVDGTPVTAERGRLHDLLQDTTRPLAQRLRELADLEAKYNIGDVYRTINVPTLPLEFLLPDRQPRFRFKNAGPATLHSATVSRVSFDERERPTIIRSPAGRDVVSRGTFWLDPGTGAVMRSELRVTPTFGAALEAVIVVDYTRNDRFDMLLPDDMNEIYITHGDRIDGHATYSNYRRFETDVRIR